MLARASLAALFGFSLLVGFSVAAQAQEPPFLRGQLWLVSNAGGLIAKRPVPTAAPDATFVTRHVSFEMTAPSGGSNVNNSIEGFLSSAHPWWVPPVEGLAFSGLYNSAVGAVVDANTPVVNSTSTSRGTYGTYMRIAGTIQLTQGQYIWIAHDNGVSLGLMASGFQDLLMGA
jgi:hypothetical protein